MQLGQCTNACLRRQCRPPIRLMPIPCDAAQAEAILVGSLTMPVGTAPLATRCRLCPSTVRVCQWRELHDWPSDDEHGNDIGTRIQHPPHQARPVLPTREPRDKLRRNCDRVPSPRADLFGPSVRSGIFTPLGAYPGLFTSTRGDRGQIARIKFGQGRLRQSQSSNLDMDIIPLQHSHD